MMIQLHFLKLNKTHCLMKINIRFPAYFHNWKNSEKGTGFSWHHFFLEIYILSNGKTLYHIFKVGHNYISL